MLVGLIIIEVGAKLKRNGGKLERNAWKEILIVWSTSIRTRGFNETDF